MNNAIIIQTHCEGLSKAEKLQFQMQLTSRQRATGVGIALALLLGGLGAHKFYLKENGMGVLYALMGTIGWAIIIPPFIVGIASIFDACTMESQVTKFNNALGREIKTEIEAMR